MSHRTRVAVVTACLCLSVTWMARAQILGAVLGPLATIDLETVVLPDDPSFAAEEPDAMAAATTQPPHFPKGGKYKLFGNAKDTVDPENPFNEVISFDTTNPNNVAGAYRKCGDKVKIDMLDNMVELKYYYLGRTCGGGSTRVQLGIDRDGDKKFDGNAFGYIGDKPFGGGCVSNMWVFEDMTNASMKWDLSQLGGSMTMSWDQMETYLNAVYPNHNVLDFVLVDDSGSFFPGDKGCAFFDLVSAGPRTLTDHEDTADGGKQPNNCGS